MEEKMTNTERAYFESEAARLFVDVDDYAFVVAVSKIPDDNGKSWRQYFVTASTFVKNGVAAAYRLRFEENNLRHAKKKEAASQMYFEQLRARHGGKNARTAAIRKAREICPDFVAPNAR